MKAQAERSVSICGIGSECLFSLYVNSAETHFSFVDLIQNKTSTTALSVFGLISVLSRENTLENMFNLHNKLRNLRSKPEHVGSFHTFLLSKRLIYLCEWRR